MVFTPCGVCPPLLAPAWRPNGVWLNVIVFQAAILFKIFQIPMWLANINHPFPPLCLSQHLSKFEKSNADYVKYKRLQQEMTVCKYGLETAKCQVMRFNEAKGLGVYNWEWSVLIFALQCYCHANFSRTYLITLPSPPHFLYFIPAPKILIPETDKIEKLSTLVEVNEKERSAAEERLGIFKERMEARKSEASKEKKRLDKKKEERCVVLCICGGSSASVTWNGVTLTLVRGDGNLPHHNILHSFIIVR